MIYKKFDIWEEWVLVIVLYILYVNFVLIRYDVNNIGVGYDGLGLLLFRVVMVLIDFDIVLKNLLRKSFL